VKTNALLIVLVCVVVQSAAAADISTISHGEEVDLEQHLVVGKYVLFDFYADWCGPCRQLTPRLEDFAAANQDTFALRKVDIVNWGSQVAQQYRLSSIPHLKLYDPEGRLVSQGAATPVLRALAEVMGEPELGAGGPSLVPLLVFAGVAAVVIYFFTGSRRKKAPPPTPPTAQ
jgi:thiol-disulfide isomerase/thioredoxin